MEPPPVSEFERAEPRLEAEPVRPTGRRPTPRDAERVLTRPPVPEPGPAREPQEVSQLASRFGAEFPNGFWNESPSQAALIPIPARGETARRGVLVAGLNPFRAFDHDYRRFLQLAAGEIGACIANAQAYEEERRRA